MKILIIGLGSMGKRRIRNLIQLKQNDLLGFDVREDRCEEVSKKYKVKTFVNLSDALKNNPNVLIISTPPDSHMKYAKIALENDLHFFTEASVVTDQMNETIHLLEKTSVVGMPSSTMRFHPIIIKIKEILQNEDIGKILSFFYNSGQYLPDWHPWEDYRKFYVSNRDTGGCREIVPFELVWITDIFGKISNVFSDKGKISSLDANIDDIYLSILGFENGIKGLISIDVISRAAVRELKILTENATIIADWNNKSIRYFIAGGEWKVIKIDEGKPEDNYIHGEKMYVDEMKNFLDLIRQKNLQKYTFKDDLQILKILETIEESSKTGIRQNVKYN